MDAVIIAVGDELVAGDCVDTNSAWLARELLDRGVQVRAHLTLPDDRAFLADRLREWAGRVDLIVVAGGLGPTADDVTRYGLADAMGETMVEDATALEVLQRRFADRGRAFAEQNRVQAQRPASARMIRNSQGTAPGIAATIGRASVYVLPGVPREMKTMWTDHVAPEIPADRERASVVEAIHCIGLPESEIGQRLRDLMERGRNPLVGTYPNDSIVTVRVRGVGPANQVQAAVRRAVEEVRDRLGNHAFACGDQTLPGVIVCRLAERSKQIATAESCTAGMLGAAITEVPGCSGVYRGGWQTYSNDLKSRCLGVSRESLKAHGAVSAPVADEMARGALANAGADYALSITGIAGPDGGTPDKPVGTVFIGLAWCDAAGDVHSTVRHFRFPGDREAVRRRSTQSALAMLHFHLAAEGDIPRLLWEARQEGA